ncbi:MAG: baseplate J/gp47 family protein [Kofleriaceae bacterium]
MFRVPSFREFEAIVVAFFKGLFPDSNAGARTAYHRRRLQVATAAGTQLHAHVDSVRDDVMPDSSRGEMAVRWGGIFGVPKKGATPARRSDALRVRGDVGTPVTSGLELVHPASGLRFMIDEDDEIPAEEEVDVDVVAIDAGSQTRLSAGEVLEFVSTPAGLQTRAELQLDLSSDGFDSEQEGAYKRRFLNVVGEPQAGGNQSDYVRWLEEIEGIDKGFAYAHRGGFGTEDLVGLHIGAGEDRALSETENAVALAYVKERAPSQVSGDGGPLRMLTVIEDPQPIEITVEPNGALEWEFDWNDETPPVVDTWDEPTRTLTFTTERPASMKAGDRVCIHGVASDQNGEVLTIEALVSTDAVKLQTIPTVAPVATDTVYAGGPLTAMIRDAIIAHVSGDIVYCGDDGPIPGQVAEASTGTLGLKELARGIGPANPGGKYGEWSGALIQAVLEKIAVYPRGARNATCLVPAADYEATDFAFPDDNQIGLITLAEVLIRRAW